MSEKQLLKLSMELEKAENSARIRQFEKAAKQYKNLIKLAQKVNPGIINDLTFLSLLYTVNHDISRRQDPLITGSLHSLDTLQKDLAYSTITMALPGGFFGEINTKRVFDETRGIVLMDRGKRERDPALLLPAIKRFLEIGKEQLFFGRYVGIIERRISGTRAALECEAESHIIRAAEIADENPSGAIPHYMLAVRAYRAARRSDCETKYRNVLIGLKKVGKCWFCGRLVQGANHFRLLNSSISQYFVNLLHENKEDLRVYKDSAVVACIPCSAAIEQEAHKVAKQYHEWTVRQFEAVRNDIRKLAEAINRLSQGGKR